MSGREGRTLAEVLVSTLLVLLLVSGSWRILTAHHRAASELVRRAELLETERTLTWVLSRELRRGGRGDRSAVAGDSLSLRAFRGSGLVCVQADSLLGVVRRGSRGPDPRKDSVLVLSAKGGWTVHRLTDRHGSAACPDEPDPAETWVLDPPPEGRSVLVRYFERGSYHVADGALRYRRGLSGRQPLTPALMGAESGLVESSGRVRSVLEWESAPGLVRTMVHTFPHRERADGSVAGTDGGGP